MDAQQFKEFMQVQVTIMEQLQKQAAANAGQKENSTNDVGLASTQANLNAAFVTSFDEFDSKKETFRNYRQRFENYLKMKSLFDKKEYCAKLLLNSIGAKHFNTVNALAAPKSPDELKYDELIETLENHLAPKKNTLVAQHQFLCKYQSEQQSVAEYTAALRTDIGDCEFTCECKKSIADVFLRAQFIRGIKDNTIREKLLQSDKKDFKDIEAVAIVLEASKLDSKELSQKQISVAGPNSTPTRTDVNKVFTQQNKQKKNNRSRSQQRGNNQGARGKSKPRINYSELGIDGLCLRCGRDNHTARECRSDRNNLKCAGCKNTGHIVRVCIKTLMEKRNNNSTKRIEHQDVQYRDFGIYHIVNIQNQGGSKADRFYAQVSIGGKPVTFEVDSGSGFSFLPRNTYAQLEIQAQLQPVPVVFRSYTNHVFTPDGKVVVEIEHRGRKSIEELYIVPEEHAALLGRVWIRKLGIDLQSIDSTQDSYTVHAINHDDSHIEELMTLYPEIFEERIGCVPDLTVSLKLRSNATPIFHREREIPYALIGKVDKELDTLEAQGIISKVDTSDWGSPLVVIPKPEDNVRLCVDYKVGVNERLVSAHHPIRKIDDIFNSLRNSRYFCRLDLYKAYLHIQVDKKSSEIQTISTHRGTYRMNRLSFGIKTAPSEFNCIINQVLQGVPKTESYFDDIIVHGETLEECKQNLHACLQRLKQKDLHVNRRKCSFFKERIEFLGHVIEYNKISKSPEKVAAIMDMKKPKGADEVRRFLGMVTYYTRFIPNASTMTAPLRHLIRKNVKFNWTRKCDTAFLDLKNEITSDRVLIPFDPSQEVEVACDAGPEGVAGVLSHRIGNVERPIAFASRALTPAEKNYSQLDREALGIVFSVSHFFPYLFARKFKLITDNSPLTRIFHQNAKLPPMTAARLQRYAAFLSGFNYEIEFKKGTENVNADCLSRAPINSKPQIDTFINEEVHHIYEETICRITSQQVTYQDVRKETAKDEQLATIIQRLTSDRTFESEFSIDDNVLFRGQRVVIPRTLQEAVLRELHRTHVGVTKMKQLARRYVYWKRIDKDIERLVRECEACVSIRHSPIKAPLHPWEEPERNWQRIHIDYAGPYQGHQFLVVMDAKSKWAEIETSTSSPTTASTIELLQEMFARHGFPDVLVSDNATIFTSEAFQEFCKGTGIFQKFIAPGHPATNGLAERNVQTLKRRLAAMSQDPAPMKAKVREILFRYRATPLINSKTPAEMYLNRQIKIQLDALKPTKFQESVEPNRQARQLSVGERVQARWYSNNKANWKLGTVKKKFGKVHYLIKLDNGYEFKRHIDQLVKTEVQPKKTVTFAPEVDVAPREAEKHKSVLPDLALIPEIVEETAEQQIEADDDDQYQDVPGEIQDLPDELIQRRAQGQVQAPEVRRSTRNRKTPKYLNAYVPR